jgi:dephospho-CoA kinase
MLKIALTGPMGSGKSTLARKLRSYGAYIADIDDIIKTHLQTNDTLINVLHSEFGATFIRDGQINLRLMYELFSKDSYSYSRFHKIIHPFIERTATELYKQAKKLNFKYFVLVAPYVVEDKNSLNRKFDFIVSVECSKENQINRLIKRTNLSKKNICDLIGLDSLTFERKLQANLTVQNNSNFKHVEMLASKINNSIQKIRNTKKIFNLKSAILSILLFSGFSGALSALPCIGTLLSSCDPNISYSSSREYDSKIYGGLKWTLNEGLKPEAVLGFRYAQVSSSANTKGADISIAAKWNDHPDLSKFRVKYFNGNNLIQPEVGIGYDMQKGLFIGLLLNTLMNLCAGDPFV